MVIGASLPRRRTSAHPVSRTDWRAVIIAVAAHVALLLALLASPYLKPPRRDVAHMILVELVNADRAGTEQQAVVQARASTRARSAVQASAAPRRERAPAPTRASRVVDGGREAAIASGTSADGIAATAAATDGRGEGRARGARFRPPRVLARVLPSYPDDAFLQGRQGSVDVIVTIDVDGAPIEAHVYTASGTPSLDRAAVAAVRSWSYAAATKNGEPTQAQAIVTIDWSIAREMRLRSASRTSTTPVPSRPGAAAVRSCLIRDAQHADLCR